MAKNKYVTDEKLEKLIGNNPKAIRKLRFLNFIRLEQFRDGGVTLKDIRKQWNDKKHPLDPLNEPLKRDYGYLKKPDIILDELLDGGFIREKDGKYLLNKEGANLVAVRLDKRPRHIRIIAKYLAAIDRAFPFPIVEDWDHFLNNSKVNLGDVDFIREANPILEFETRERSLTYNTAGNIIKFKIDAHVYRHIIDIFKKIDVSYGTVTKEFLNADQGADYFDGITWNRCDVYYRHRLNGKEVIFENLIPVKIKQYNLNWYFIGLDSIDQNLDVKRPHILSMEKISRIVWKEQDRFEVEGVTDKLNEVADYWKYCAGLYRLQNREQIEFRIKDGSRHQNKKYIVNEMIHDGFRSNSNINDDWVVFDFEDPLHYGPEIWRFLRKWGANNLSGIWPKKLYLDVNEDLVITFSNNGTVDEFTGDDFSMESWKKYQNSIAFLGNMVNSRIIFEEKVWKSAEALFQALRFQDQDVRESIREAKTAFAAKKIARSAKNKSRMTVFPGSEKDVKNMQEVLWLKFTQNKAFAEKLMATGTALIVEDAGSREDKDRALFWGAVYTREENIKGSAKWHGENLLGKLLMLTREKLKVYGG